jgi:hypothetical protein
MATKAQINANRENAKKSHGATTPEGQEASSRNRTSHGLTYHSGQFFLLEDESKEKFRELMNNFAEEYNPQTVTERSLVRHMVHHEWLRARALRFQHCWFNPQGGFVTTDGLQVFVRYQAQHERGFYKALRELQNLRKERRNNEIGFESQKLKVSAERRAFQTLELKKQTFDLRKEELQIKRIRVEAASASGTTTEQTKSDPEMSPGEQKMAA